MKKLNKKIRIPNSNNLRKYRFDNKKINIINKLQSKKAFEKYHLNQNLHENSFKIALSILKGITDKLINGPISKNFLKINF